MSRFGIKRTSELHVVQMTKRLRCDLTSTSSRPTDGVIGCPNLPAD